MRSIGVGAVAVTIGGQGCGTVILDAKNIESLAHLTTDVCVVGSGAAGITLALELSRRKIDVIVLTGGRERESAADRDLYRGTPDSGHPHEPLEENRRRVFGGTTVAWGGRCIPLEPIDFSPRPWVPHSGWPIPYAEVLPYFDRAMELCEAGPFSFSAADVFSPDRGPLLDGFDNEDIISTNLERWSPPTNFAKRYGNELRQAPSLQVILGGHAIHVQLDADGKSVKHIVASGGGDHRFFVTGRSYVLAAGGLENPRLLLNSADIHSTGIGNSADLVGRFYMSHLTGVVSKIAMAEPRPVLRSEFEKDQAGVYCRRRFALTPFAQTTHQVGNAIAMLHRPPIGSAIHRDPLFSAAFLVRSYLDVASQGSPGAALARLRANSQVRREHWKVLAETRADSISAVARTFRDRYLGKRRLPSVLAPPSAAEQHIMYYTEHAPNPDSRVVLADERDAFGLLRITVLPAFSDVDAETIIELHRLLAERFDKTGFGSVEFNEPRLREYVRDYPRHFNSQAHHLGTTRMSLEPADGVVDLNCEVYNVRGLFVMGSSVFPTGGHANPTLTIVALSARLAEHLSKQRA
jgi:choline dehydrogenase-like flavoprotein